MPPLPPRRLSLPVAALLLGAAVFFVWNRAEPVRVPRAAATPLAAVAPAVALGKEEPVADCCPGAAEPGVPVRVANPVALAPAQVAGGLDAFRAWAERYAAVAVAEKAALLPEGRALAGARREAMGALIRRDPRAAIAALLPYELRKGLPPAIAAMIEHRVSGRGDLMVLAVRPLPGQSVEEPIYRTASVAGKDYRAYTYGRRLADISRPQTPILGVGVQLADGKNLLAVREEGYAVLEKSEAADLRAAQGAANAVCPISGDATAAKGDETAVDTGAKIVWLCSHGHIGEYLQTPEGLVVAAAGGTGNSGSTSPVVPATATEGNKTFLAIRVRFSDQAAEPTSDANLQTELQKVVDQWHAWSYGKLEGSFAFTPTLVLPQNEAYYAAQGDPNSAVMSAARTAADAYVDGSSAHPYLQANWDYDAIVFSGSIGGYCGLGYIGGRGTWIKCYSAGVMLHEWGHNLGLWHANFWQASTDSPIGAGTHVEYGSKYSVMGSAGLNAYNSLERYTLHWLEPTDVATLAAGSTYRLYNADKSTLTATHPYALRIYKKDLVYYVEYRPNWNGTSHDFTTDNGAMICRTQPGSDADQLLDMNPLTSAGNGDAALLVGRSFTDAAQGVTVTPIARGGVAPDDWLDMVVNFTSPVTNSAPVAVVAASNFTPGTGVSVTLTATASDPDGDPLAYAWDFGENAVNASNVSVNNSAVQTKSWSTAGDYAVRCTVSDMKGKTSVQNLVIRVGAPATFTIKGRVVKADGTPVPDVLIEDTSSHITYTDADGRYSLGGLAAGSYTISALHSGWTLAAQFANPVILGPGAVNIDFTATAPAADGGVTLEHWDGISGNPVANLTSNAAYPNSPTYVTTLEGLFEAGTNIADNYGQRARAWFRPPTTGAYTFYIASDDNSELWLSTDDTAANRVKIASVTGSTGVRAWTTFASQTSAAKTLTAGQRYYIEALHKEGGGGDNLAVGVDFPGAVQHRPIETTYLEPITAVLPPVPVNTVTIAATDASASETGPATGTFTITRTGDTTAALPVYFDVTGTATYGADFLATGVSATIPAGAASTTVTITPIDDALPEADETVVVQLAPSLTYTLGTPVSDTVIIHDNEAALVSIVATDATAAETGGDTGTFTLTRTGDTTSALAVAFTIGGNATNGADYPTLTSPVTIPAGQSTTTITIAPTSDGVTEPEETIVLTLAAGAGYTVSTPSAATVRILAQPGTGGGILREWFDGLNGNNTVADLLNAANFPFAPSGSEIVTTVFETPQSSPDKNNFGERWRAIFTAPSTGSYYFYIASDDASDLWLSTDATPERKQRICYASGATGFQVWTAQGSQKSAAIVLTAGQRYYIEALFKEGVGGDYLSVGVEYPNGALERPIPAHRLDPFTPSTPVAAPWVAQDIGTTGSPGASGLGSDSLPAGPTHRYSFSGTASAAIADGAVLTDSIGTAHGALRGAGALFNAGGDGVDLPGGASATQAYIDLPNGVITGTIGGGTRYTSATYETWVMVSTTQNWARIFNFGTSSIGDVIGAGGTFVADDAQHIFLSASNGTGSDQRLGRYYPAGTTDATRDTTGTAVNGTQFHIVLTYDAAAQNWRWYRNGMLMQVLPDTQGLTTINDLNNWLGRSMWSPDSNLDGTFDEFRIYNYALTEAQIRGNRDAGADAVNTLNDGGTGPYWESGGGTLSTGGATDAFHFDAQPLTGDWDVRARLVSLTNPNAAAIAGLMMREGNAANARHAFIGLTPDAAGHFIARTATAGNAATANLAGLAFPQWLRLIRSGDTLTGYVSADNATWVQIGATATLTGLGSTLQVGFAVAGGGTANRSALAQFDSLTFSPAPGGGDGFRYERFEGIAGATVATLTSAAIYPNSPTLSEVRGGFLEVAQSSPAIDNFGGRLRGYLVAPQTGAYTFYVSGDDTAELWLSTNDTAASRVKIASVAGATGFRVWTKFAAQKSAAITLTAGQRYYLEVLHKEATAADYVSVGVVFPNGAPEFPLLASRLESYVAPLPFAAPWSSADVGTPGASGSSGYFPTGYTGAGDALPSGPRHRYSFSGTANAAAGNGTVVVDSVSGQHGVVRGAGAVFDAGGAGLGLPGGASATQAYVDLPNGVATGTFNAGTRYTNVSYELWYTQRTNQQWCRVLDFGTNGSGEITAPGGTFSGTNYLMLSGDVGTAPDQRFQHTGTVGTVQGDALNATALNQLAHVVIAYDATAAAWRWSRNGVLMDTVPDTDGVTSLTDVNVWLGRSNFSADANLDAVLHEFRIYNYALTSAQVLGNFTAGPDLVNTSDSTPARAPRHRWKFDGTASQSTPDGTWIYDQIGGANALVRGAGAVFSADGKGVTLPGGSSATQGYIDLPNGTAAGTESGGARFTSVSYELWATQTANNSNSHLLDFGTGTAGELTGLGGSATGTNYIRLAGNVLTAPDGQLRRKATATNAVINTTGTTVLGQLAHHVVTYAAAAQQWQWWRNGVLTATLADTDGVSTLADVNAWLGRSQYTADGNWAGTLHDFRIYDYALTPAQVLANFDAGPDAQNIAAPGLAGTAAISGAGTLSTNGASDAFQFTSQTMDGDGEIIARLVSKSSGGGVAGLMIRESSAVGARHSFIGYLSGAVSQAINRTTANGSATTNPLTSFNPALWYRIVRKGDTVGLFYSLNGTAWLPGGTVTHAGLPVNVLAGLAVSSGGAALADAVFDNVQIIRPTVTIAATQNAVEYPAQNGVFTITRTWDTTNALTVSYTTGGSATAGADYAALSGTVTIPAGQASATITVTPIDDALNEGNETVVVALADADGYLLGGQASDTLTIAGSDATTIFNNTATGTTLAWSQGANWQGGLAAQSNPGATVEFFTGQTLPGGTITANNDNAGAFQLGTLRLAGAGPASGTTTVTLTGGALTLGGLPGAAFALDATNGTGLTYNVAVPVNLTGIVNVQGAGTATFKINSAITGGGLNKTSTGGLNLTAANAFTGPVTVGAGRLFPDHVDALAGAVSLTVAGGAEVQANAAGTYANVPATLTGAGAASFEGALYFRSGGTTTVTWPGAITLGAGGATIHSFGVTYNVTLGGALGGAGGLTLAGRGGSTASNTATFTLGAASNYAGATTILNNDGLLDARVKLGIANALPTTTTLTLDGIGAAAIFSTLDLAGFNQTLAGLATGTGGANVTRRIIGSTGSATLTINATTAQTYSGALGASGANNLGLTKSGAATLTLSGAAGANTFIGATTVTAGTLALSGTTSNVASSAVLDVRAGATLDAAGLTGGFTVGASQTLQGGGTLRGAVTINGTHRPGDGFGAQTFANALNYGAAARVKWEVAGNSGAAFDSISAASLAVTAGAAFDVTLNAAGSTVNFDDPFWMQARSWIVVTAAGGIAGTFATGTVSADSAAHAAALYGQFAVVQTATTVSLTWTPAPIQTWRLAKFGANAGNAAISGDFVDVEKDGLVNLMEYALGQNPNAASPGALPQAVIEGAYLTMTYPRAKAATDITLRAVWTTAMSGWSAAGVTEDILADDGTIQTVKAKVLTAPDAKKFLRLEATRP